ncbi:SDR family oxidoreductase [Pedobacter miscanthi]|uniref:Oxidoreductase n=1 Tax=Pedobacter miscanthi TaxID=2259170 RepID=A0A366KYL4_9SPHI|nr:SDR family oxidoreductase [Pedobacter miscanthi]RBQ06735.1 oxidoreductase [Pedobacter miscanthi]
MKNINGKVVVITGASSGMGAETAKKLGALGAKVVLGARRQEKLDSLVASIGDNARYMQSDVTKKEDVDRLLKFAIDTFGKIDVLWNNAGVMPISFFDEGNLEEWERMIDVNIKGVLYGIHAVLPHMIKNGNGHIISTSSTAGLKIFPSTGVYSATKGAVKSIMEGLREEMAGKIKVTTLYPGAVSTELGSDITSRKVFEMMEAMGQIATIDAEAIADAVVYAINQPNEVAVNEITIRPLQQAM